MMYDGIYDIRFNKYAMHGVICDTQFQIFSDLCEVRFERSDMISL